ncbi:MAG: hypothetical protein PVI21_00875 [Candidatus Woesebacteria bacterium]|jgi:hypothetical protein
MSSHRLSVDVVPQASFGQTRRRRGHIVLVLERVTAIKHAYTNGRWDDLAWGGVVLAIVHKLNASMQDGKPKFTNGEVDATLRYLWGAGEITAPEESADEKGSHHVAIAGV